MTGRQIAVNTYNQLREALDLVPLEDRMPDAYWEAVVDGLREWAMGGSEFEGYEWEGKLYPHFRKRVRRAFRQYNADEWTK